MKIAYIILAHKNPAQVGRLLRKLDGPDVGFFVHIDRRVDIGEFANLNYFGNLHYVQREEGRWGNFGIVQAVLNAMPMVLQQGFDYVILLSGQCYPIANVEKIHKFLNANPKNYVESAPIDLYTMERFKRYHFNGQVFPPYKDPVSLRERLAYHALKAVLPFPRPFVKGLKPYYGSQWFSLNIEAVRYILDFLQQRPEYVNFYKFTRIPDELFFQTILFNSELKNTVVNDNLRHIEWADQRVPHPVTLKNLSKILQSGKFFARKFDSLFVLDKIDKTIAV